MKFIFSFLLYLSSFHSPSLELYAHTIHFDGLCVVSSNRNYFFIASVFAIEITQVT